MRKAVFFTAIVIAISFIATSFTKPTDSGNWEKFKTFKGVDFYQKSLVVSGENFKHEYIVFKYVNTSSKQINLNWKLNIYYGDNCRSCNLQSPNEYEINLKLASNQTIVSSEKSEGFKHKIFVKDLNKQNQTQLSKFELSNLR